MFTLISAFLSLIVFLAIGIQAVIAADSFLASITALGAYWAMSAILRETL